MNKLIITLVTSASLLAACGSGASSSSSSPPTSDNTQAYLAALSVAGIDTSTQAADYIATGHDICDKLASGQSHDAVLNEEVNIGAQAGYSADDMGIIVGAATQTFCPQYNN